jgi:20S proteasome alpha/beta subunit
MGQTTIRQSVRKLSIIEEKVVIGVSGPVGLSQRFTTAVEALWKKQSIKAPAADAMCLISEHLRKHIIPELEAAQAASKVIGSAAALSVISQTVVALPVGKHSVELFQFDQQGSPEAASSDLPFVAIGSGQKTAEPFLAFLRRIFWPTQLPKLSEGVFATIWALEHAISTSPGGVAEPKQIVLVDKESGDWKAHELQQDIFVEHMQAIAAAERTLADFRSGLSGAAGAILPDPPKVDFR